MQNMTNEKYLGEKWMIFNMRRGETILSEKKMREDLSI